MLRFDKATYQSLLFKFVFTEILSTELRGSDVLSTISRIDKCSTPSVYNFTEFIILLYTCLVISFARYKE